MSDHAGLLDAIRADPYDVAALLALTDWLEDHDGDPARIEFVRVWARELQAIGVAGPIKPDRFVRRLPIKAGRILKANLLRWLPGQAAMPTLSLHKRIGRKVRLHDFQEGHSQRSFSLWADFEFVAGFVHCVNFFRLCDFFHFVRPLAKCQGFELMRCHIQNTPYYVCGNDDHPFCMFFPRLITGKPFELHTLLEGYDLKDDHGKHYFDESKGIVSERAMIAYDDALTAYAFGGTST